MEQKIIHKPKFKFMAMSKLIGLVSFSFVLAIVIYAMYEMHVSQIYDALPQLIISAFAFASIYTGFYLTMAKMEHVEQEKTLRERELKSLEKQKAHGKNIDEDTINRKKLEIEALTQKMNDIISETTQSLL